MNHNKKVLESIKISVVIPVYNVEKYLVRCVTSVQRQTHKNIEIILVNDGSRDNSGEICSQLAAGDDRIIVIWQENKGVSGARNSGIEVAGGNYIGFVDSDDWIADDFYEHLLRLAVMNNADIVTSTYVRTGRIKRKKLVTDEKTRLLDQDGALKFFLSTAIRGGVSDASCCSKLYRKESIANIVFPIDMAIYEDVLFNWCAIKNIKKYVITNYSGYFYFKNCASLTSDVFSPKILDIFDITRIMGQDYSGNDKEIELLLLQYAARADYSVLIRIIKSKKHVDKKLSDRVLRNTRQNYRRLMESPLSFIRKCVLTIIKIIPVRIFEKYIMK